MKNFWKDPFLHFLIGGAILFFVLRGNQPEDADTGDRSREIVITEGRMSQLVEIFQKTWQRPPTGQELQGLIDDFVQEEIYYREAIALGLDRDDTVIRRRMRQKIEFLSNDLADPGDPGDEVLQAWYEENPDPYREDPRYTFHQVYLDPDKHTDIESAAESLRKQLKELPSDSPDDALAELSDGLRMVPPSLVDRSETQIARELGQDFAASLADLSSDKWVGPIRSGFGFHLVRIDEKTPGRQPELADVRPQVLRDWNAERRREGNDQFYESLFHRYTITFENADGTRHQVDAPAEQDPEASTDSTGS